MWGAARACYSFSWQWLILQLVPSLLGPSTKGNRCLARAWSLLLKGSFTLNNGNGNGIVGSVHIGGVSTATAMAKCMQSNGLPLPLSSQMGIQPIPWRCRCRCHCRRSPCEHLHLFAYNPFMTAKLRRCRCRCRRSVWTNLKTLIAFIFSLWEITVSPCVFFRQSKSCSSCYSDFSCWSGRPFITVQKLWVQRSIKTRIEAMGFNEIPTEKVDTAFT